MVCVARALSCTYRRRPRASVAPCRDRTRSTKICRHKLSHLEKNMANSSGYSFSPDLQNRLRQSLNSPTGGGLLPQNASQALKVLSLSLPGNVGGSPIAPDALLRPSHSFTPDAAVRSMVGGGPRPPAPSPMSGAGGGVGAPSAGEGGGGFDPGPGPQAPPQMTTFSFDQTPPSAPPPVPPSAGGFGGGSPVPPQPNISFGGGNPVADTGGPSGGVSGLLDAFLRGGGNRGSGGFSGRGGV